MLEEAIEICEKGVSAHPSYASGFVVRGKCYYDLGNTDQAEASFEKVLSIDANNLVALKYIGMILADRGRADEARERFERILALDPEHREIAEKLAGLGGPPERSLADALEDTADPAPDDPSPIEPSAPEDETFVGEEIKLGGDEPTADVLATMTLADIYAVQGYRGKAVKIYRRLLEGRPNDEAIRSKLRELGAHDAHEEKRTEAASPVEPKADTPAPGAPDAATEPDPEPDSESTVEAAAKPESDAKPLDPRSMQQFRRWLDSFNS
jgi:tetratricopeptide (TPR) repeat protein